MVVQLIHLKDILLNAQHLQVAVQVSSTQVSCISNWRDSGWSKPSMILTTQYHLYYMFYILYYIISIAILYLSFLLYSIYNMCNIMYNMYNFMISL